MAVSMSCSLACVVPRARWRSYGPFGANGACFSSSERRRIQSILTLSACSPVSRPYRAAIEEDYAKRLAKLSKQPLGRDEVGYVVLYCPILVRDVLIGDIRELRNSLDTLRLETEHQASAHAALVQSMRRELEVPASEFVAKQAHHKKTAYANIEKAFKVKQQQESIVAKVRNVSTVLKPLSDFISSLGSGEVQDRLRQHQSLHCAIDASPRSRS